MTKYKVTKALAIS